jgi:hypothetical protein
MEGDLSRIINAIPGLVWSAAPDGSIDFVNQTWCSYTGVKLDDACGYGWQAAVHPDDAARLNRNWRSILDSGQPGEVEARLRRSDGTFRWFLIRAVPLRDEAGRLVKWYGQNMDITNRKQSEEDLRRSTAFLAEAQRLSLTGSFSWSVTTNEVTWSEQTYRIFGLDPSVDLTPEVINSRVHPEDVARLNEICDRARVDGRGLDFEHRLRMPDDTIKYVHMVAHGTRDQYGGLEYIGAIQDVTVQRLSQEALSKVRSELAHVARVTSLGALTASIAHEINQPLSGIITNASTCLRMLAAEPPNVCGASETARRTIRDGNRASNVVTRLRELFRKTDPKRESVDLNDATREVIALLSSELRRRRAILKVELTDNLPAVTGDRVQLQQVVLNLLINAAQAMSAVEDRPRELFIRTQLDEAAEVRLTVQDAGVGFERDGEERLFEAFYTTKSDGMGMGLSVSRFIIESHHGRLWASPNDGPGATFSFSLPKRPESRSSVHSLGAASRVAVAAPMMGNS